MHHAETKGAYRMGEQNKNLTQAFSLVGGSIQCAERESSERRIKGVHGYPGDDACDDTPCRGMVCAANCMRHIYMQELERHLCFSHVGWEGLTKDEVWEEGSKWRKSLYW